MASFYHSAACLRNYGILEMIVQKIALLENVQFAFKVRRKVEELHTGTATHSSSLFPWRAVRRSCPLFVPRFCRCPWGARSERFVYLFLVPTWYWAFISLVVEHCMITHSHGQRWKYRWSHPNLRLSRRISAWMVHSVTHSIDRFPSPARKKRWRGEWMW